MTVAHNSPVGGADRLAKLFVDLQEEPDQDAAAERLRRTPVQLVIGRDVPASETLQVVAVAVVATGSRAFPAGLNVVLAGDGPIRLGRATGSLSRILIREGATLGSLDLALPTVVVGDPGEEVASDLERSELVLRAVPRRWAGGVVPLATEAPRVASGQIGAALAGGLAISELFHSIHELLPLAGRRTSGFSLWDPKVDWSAPEAIGPQLQLLPSELWLLGLGHLGQALAWLLRFLPWSEPEKASVYLQDDDIAKEENLTTSILTSTDQLRRQKTRVVADALEDVGMRTRLVERRFVAGQARQPGEPACAIAGFDTPQARQSLDDGGWSHLIDMGIGAGAHSFTQLIVHRLGGRRSSREIFEIRPDDRAQRLVENVPAYRARAEEDGDPCGALEVAGEAVGTAFVGLVTAAVSLAEVLRPLHEGFSSELVVADLREPADLELVVREGEPAGVAAVTPARAPREA